MLTVVSSIDARPSMTIYDMTFIWLEFNNDYSLEWVLIYYAVYYTLVVQSEDVRSGHLISGQSSASQIQLDAETSTFSL